MNCKDQSAYNCGRRKKQTSIEMGQEQSQQQQETKGNETSSFDEGRNLNDIPKQKAKLGDIVVVKDMPDAPTEIMDETLAKLKKLRITYPVIKNVGGVPIEGIDSLTGLNADPVTEMLLRYQYHLTECAEAVAFDQNALSKRMKEVELFSARVLKAANDRQKQMDQSLGSIQKFFEIDSLIDRIGNNMDKTIQLMQNLNALLPQSERFSPEELDVRSQKGTLLFNQTFLN